METAPVVFIVDDDAEMRASLCALVESVGHTARPYQAAEEFLKRSGDSEYGCLILDVRIADARGLEVLEHLPRRHGDVPIIVITAQADVAMAVRALRNGAFDFLEKPFRSEDLLDRTRAALRLAEVRHRDRVERETIAARFEKLTPRERQVVGMVVGGLANKQIAAELGVTVQAVDACRARAMKKVRANSVADVVRQALQIGFK